MPRIKKKDAMIAYVAIRSNSDLSSFEIGKEYSRTNKAANEVPIYKNTYFSSYLNPKDILNAQHNIIRIISYNHYKLLHHHYKILVWGDIFYINDNKDSNIYSSHIKILEEVDIIEEIINYKDNIKYKYAFKDDEEKTIINRNSFGCHDKEEWNIRKTRGIHIGDEIIIFDRKYNRKWRCVHKENDEYYLLSEFLDTYYIHPFYNASKLEDTHLYEKVLSPLGNKLSEIFDQDVHITLPSVKEIDELYIKDNFTFFKICNSLDSTIIPNSYSNEFWTRDVYQDGDCYEFYTYWNRKARLRGSCLYPRTVYALIRVK